MNVVHRTAENEVISLPIMCLHVVPNFLDARWCNAAVRFSKNRVDITAVDEMKQGPW